MMKSVERIDPAYGGDASSARVELRSMGFTLELGIASRAAIGLIALASDGTIEHEWRLMFRDLDGATFFQTRIMNEPMINAASLRSMGPRLAGAASVIRPGSRLDAVAFGCTSAAMLLGPEAVAREIRKGRGEVPCTTPISAALAGLKTLGRRRVALLSPYVGDVNEAMRRFLTDHGVSVPITGSFNLDDDNVVARIAPASIFEAAAELGNSHDVEAVFISCTTLRVLDLLDNLEARLGKPVISSNQALVWHGLRLAGFADPIDGFGRLPKMPLS